MSSITKRHEVSTRHGGTWTIVELPCHISDYSNSQFNASPENIENSTYVMKSEWNGWRFFAADSEGNNIGMPIQVLKKMIELAKESEHELPLAQG